MLAKTKKYSSEEYYELTIQEFWNEKYQKYKGVYVNQSCDLGKPIFRYIKFEHLLSMLNKRELYIANRKTFNDASEVGRKNNNKYIYPLSIASGTKRDIKEAARAVYNRWAAAYSVCISCWTYDALSNENGKVIDENYLMWKSYGSSGVCCRIETTIADLLDSVTDQNNYEILASDVKYVHEHLSDGFVQHYIFEKPIYYRDEKEFRLCVLAYDDFVRLKIDPFKMIKSITLSPYITSDYSDFIKESIKRRFPNLNVQISKSKIMEF